MKILYKKKYKKTLFNKKIRKRIKKIKRKKITINYLNREIKKELNYHKL